MTALDQAPAATIRPGVGVTLFVSDAPDPVFGVVARVYIDAAGTEVAEIQISRRRSTVQATRFLTVVTS